MVMMMLMMTMVMMIISEVLLSGLAARHHLGLRADLRAGSVRSCMRRPGGAGAEREQARRYSFFGVVL